jgi:light-regulated signal transduction histidine kinase (bacteriophytochrome)
MGGVIIDQPTDTSICFVLDLSERKQAEASIQQLAIELARSNRELEQYASMASHDLQEPLRTIASYVSLLARKHPELLDSESREFVQYIVEATQRMRELILKLLAFSQVGSKMNAPRPVDCHQVVDETVRALRASIEESQAAINIEMPLSPVVLGDPTQLGQLFQNLVSNAIKYRAQEKPRIFIRALRREVCWLFSVEDNGIGIQAGEHTRIFQMFHRTSHPANCPGSGIGLAVCKKIVENHGGEIWVEPNTAAGSTFFFTLPVLSTSK